MMLWHRSQSHNILELTPSGREYGFEWPWFAVGLWRPDAIQAPIDPAPSGGE